MERLRQLFSNPELRKRLLFTLVLLVIYRFGVHVSVPGVNANELAKNLGKAGDLLNVVDLFSGGAFKKFSVFALGIEPSQPAWKAGALPLSYTRSERAIKVVCRPRSVKRYPNSPAVNSGSRLRAG